LRASNRKIGVWRAGPGRCKPEWARECKNHERREKEFFIAFVDIK